MAHDHRYLYESQLGKQQLQRMVLRALLEQPNFSYPQSELLYSLGQLQNVWMRLGSYLARPIDTANGTPIYQQQYNQFMQDIHLDLLTAEAGIEGLSNQLGIDFNRSSVILQQIRAATTRISGALLNITRQTEPNRQPVIEYFRSAAGIDRQQVAGNHVQINNGVASLPQTASAKIAITSIEIDGNGMVNEQHGDATMIIDGRPDTWFEYERTVTNAPTDQPPLLLRLTMRLAQTQSINWVRIVPYLSPDGDIQDPVLVRSIGLSKDGITWTPIYSSQPSLNTELTMLPKSALIADPFSGIPVQESKLATSGEWAFMDQEAQIIQVLIEQRQPRPVTLSRPRYTRYVHLASGSWDSQVLEESEVPQAIREGLPGRYGVDPVTYIEKELRDDRAYRWSIGAREIEVRQERFAETAELISQPQQMTRPIRSIQLAANERIPNLIDSTIGRYGWVQYYVSLDHNDWLPIRPRHHQPLYGEDLPPELIVVNHPGIVETYLDYRTVSTSEPAMQLRWRVVMQRPVESHMLTPILEELALDVEVEALD